MSDDPSADSLKQQLSQLSGAWSATCSFDGQGEQQLWAWQQDKLRLLKELIRLDMPMVYQQPQWTPVQRGGRPRCGLIETEPSVHLSVAVHHPQREWIGDAVVMLCAEHPGAVPLIKALTEQGAAVFVLRTRRQTLAADFDAAALAAHYLRCGKTDVGCGVLDSMRLVDWVEGHADFATEWVSMICWGRDLDIAASAMAVDKRIRGLLAIDPELDDQVDRTPSMICAGLAGGVQLALNCCVPRPVMLCGSSGICESIHTMLQQTYNDCYKSDGISHCDNDGQAISHMVSFLRQSLA